MTTTTGLLADSISHRLQKENLPIGTYLGTEAELAEKHGVSRNITREAVLRLKSLGILESRKRKGLFYRQPDPLKLLADTLPFLSGTEGELIELAQLRYVIEVGAIELAVVNATEKQITQLREMAHAFESLVEAGGTDQQENELELAFHGLILEMTGSRLVAGLHRVLSRFFELNRGSGITDGRSQQTVWEHHALVAAIQDRDVERARTFIRNHFRTFLFSNTSPIARQSSKTED
jgi:DNA-binding FadR family transcriptional regulator